MESKCFMEETDVRSELAKLGLTPEILSRSVMRGMRELDAADGDLPTYFRRMHPSAWIVASLVKQLSPDGWSLEEWKNWPRVVNRERTIAIAVAAGDAMTGLLGPELPKTKCPKGPMSELAVITNQMTLELYPEPETSPAEPEGLQTHFLLYHWSAQAGTARCELSLPIGRDETDRLSEWERRIIVGEIGGQPEPLLLSDSEPAPEVDITVERKAE